MRKIIMENRQEYNQKRKKRMMEKRRKGMKKIKE